MIYDAYLNRGVRKKYLPEPNPQKVEFPRDASLKVVFEKAKDLYFQDMEVDPKSLCLADSGGVLIPVKDQASWCLSHFYSKNSLQPSRYKLYVVAGSQEVHPNNNFVKGLYYKMVHIFMQEQDSDGETPSKLGWKLYRALLYNLHVFLFVAVHTECIITPCTDCEQPFRTYVPNTICRLPDGGSVFYRDPQTLCPACDTTGFGTFWNLDLFPQFQPKKPAEKDA